MKKKLNERKGDTIIEVVFAVAVFAAVSVGAIMIMNKGLNKTTVSLELTLSREEINAQAEAIRFIHENHVAEMSLNNGNRPYQRLWDQIVALRRPSSDYQGSNMLFGNVTSNGACTTSGSSHRGQFVINTRSINPANTAGTVIIRDDAFRAPAGTYARLIYNDLEDTNAPDPINLTSVKRAEGIWAVNTYSSNQSDQKPTGGPPYYDVYILACWQAPGEPTPSTLGTLIRLYNPD